MTFVLRVDEQVQLRQLEEAHLDEHFLLLMKNKHFIGVWEPWVNAISYDGQLDYVRYMQDQQANGIAFTCGIWYAESHDAAYRLVGNVTYRVSRDVRSTELGYWLAEAYTHRGIVTRAVKTLMHHAFETDNLNRVLIRAAAGNTASCAVAERLGFHLDGVIRGDLRLNGDTIDRAIYTMLAADWRSAQSGL